MDKGLQGGKIMQGKFSDYLLVSDMDATLLDDNHTISEENRQAIMLQREKWLRQFVHICRICT